MKKHLLIGETRAPGFANLRLYQFSRALPHAQVCDWRDTLPPASALFSAGIYHPTQSALLGAHNLPLWLDLPGDPFADAQAAQEIHPQAARQALLLFAPALARGDHFSTIGLPARYALLGQLGLLGRLAPLAPGIDPVSIVELAWDFPQARPKPRPTATGPIRVSLSGSFNTWFDAVTLAEGLLMAADRVPVEVQVLGGKVVGHSESSYHWFQAKILQSRHARCFRFLDPVKDADLGEILADREVGICLDKPGFEPVFGSRTRVLFWRYMGLKVIVASQTGFCQELAAQKQIVSIPTGSPEALMEALIHIRDLPTPDAGWLEDRFAPEKIFRPLQDWEPVRLPGAVDAWAELLAEKVSLERELARVRGSLTWTFLNRLHRTLKRRGGSDI